MENASQRKQVPLSQVSDTLEKTITNLDQARADDLDEMSQVRTAKFAGLARDRDRRVAKLGATHPRVIALDRSLALHSQTTAGFRIESAAASVNPPRVNQHSWALHGNVLDASRAPAPGVTVALYQKDTWVHRLGYACTDANGYFVLPVEEASKTDTGSLSINVLRSEKVIYIDPNPVEIQPGHVEYRELVIDRTPDVCPPPVGKSETPPPRATTASSGGSEEPAPKPKKGSTRK
jgi:hypothetical protein